MRAILLIGLLVFLSVMEGCAGEQIELRIGPRETAVEEEKKKKVRKVRPRKKRSPMPYKWPE